MFCVIQEIQRKRADNHGAYKRLSVKRSYHFNDDDYRYSYEFNGGRFERSILTAYKISIHQSKRVDGKVTKNQYVVMTIGYYDFLDYSSNWWFGDDRLQSIADNLQVPVDEILELIEGKVIPLANRTPLKTSYKASKEMV